MLLPYTKYFLGISSWLKLLVLTKPGPKIFVTNFSSKNVFPGMSRSRPIYSKVISGRRELDTPLGTSPPKDVSFCGELEDESFSKSWQKWQNLKGLLKSTYSSSGSSCQIYFPRIYSRSNNSMSLFGARLKSFRGQQQDMSIGTKSDSAVYYLRQQHKFGLSNAARGQQMSALVKANRFSWILNSYMGQRFSC